MTKPLPLSPHQRRQLAVAACVSEATVRRYCEGYAAHSTTEARIVEVAAKLGFALPERSAR